MNKKRKIQRQELAKKNQAKRDVLGPAEQLRILDARLGKGVGAVKERARLARLMRPKSRKKKSETKQSQD